MNFPWSKRDGMADGVQSAALPAALLVAPRPVPAAPAMEDNEIKAYLTVADALGFEPGVLLRARFLAFLRRHNIDTYPSGAVVEYMTHRARRESPNGTWWWRPLRPADVITEWQWGLRGVLDPPGPGPVADYYSSGRWECRPYDKAVPLRVLMRVQQAEAEFRGRIKYFVTDYGVMRPDPFIAAVALDMPRVVFDVWDEPDFGASPR